MEESEKIKITQNQAYKEVDFIDLASKLWIKRRLIIKTTVIFTVLGLLVAIFTPNQYTASTTMVPQSVEKKIGGNLSGLAAMAGINLGSLSSGEVLSPTVYPKILNNINFQKELIYSKYSFNNADRKISYFEYMTDKKHRPFNLVSSLKKYTFGLPSVLKSALSSEAQDSNNPSLHNSNLIYQLTLKESKVIQSIFKKLSFSLNDKEGFFTLSFTSEDPMLSAEVVIEAQRLLQKYITEFKIEKVKSNLQFVEKSYEDARINFENKQIELARFRDANKSISSAIARTQEEKLSSEYNLLLGVYTEIAKQREQAKIAVTETTPILTIIEPVVIPSVKSGPSKVVILFGFIFLGLIVCVGWILGFPYLCEIIEKIKK